MINSAFSGNTASNGGAMVATTATVNVVGSTFIGNRATKSDGGGAIWLYNPNGEKFRSVSSIFIGNTSNGVADDVVNYNNLSDAVDRYSLFGQGSAAFMSSTSQTNVVASAVFDGNSNDKYDIQELGAAATTGTLFGQRGEYWYYLDSGNWREAATGSTSSYNFDAADTTTYGLTGGTVYTTGLNDRSRLGGTGYPAGAYAISQTPETPSMIVTTTEDVVDEYDGLISLREAATVYADVAAVYAAANGTVTFDASILDADGNATITLDGGGQIELAKNITIDGNAHRIFSATNGAAASVFSVALNNLTLKNGCTNGATISAAGAAVCANGVALAVSNTTFTQNVGSGNGNWGGALYFDGKSFADATLQISDSTFSANTGSNGGAIGLINCASGVVIEGTTFENNTANGTAGAIMAQNAAITVVDSEFLGNKTANTTKNGGAIFSQSLALVVENSTFSGNSAGANGGAIYKNGGSLNLVGSTLTGNTATTGSGGGVYNTGGVLNLVDSLIVGNTASTDAAANVACSGAAATFNAYYSLLGTYADSAVALATQTGTEIGVAAADIFNTTTTDPFDLLATGVAARNGTLFGTTSGGEVWYLNKTDSKWHSVGATVTTYDFVAGDTPYGLTDGTVNLTALNGISRDVTGVPGIYPVGAYSVVATLVFCHRYKME